MIQIYRDRITSKGHRGFFPSQILAPSVTDLFQNIEMYIDKVPKDERYNLHYLLCNTEKDARKSFINQNIIAFDLDDIDVKRLTEYLPPVLHVIKMEESECGIVCSGNGLHFLVETDQIITDPKYFSNTRNIYKAICDKINKELKVLGLKGEAESGPWSAGHTLRLPNTKNIKTPEVGYKNKNSTTDCIMHQRFMKVQVGYCIENLVDMEQVKVDDALNNYDEYKQRFAVDTEAVLNECAFIKWNREYAHDVKEADWYKALSIVSRLENGKELCHSMSEGHAGYSPEETDAKIEQSLLSSGPRTCKNIRENFSGCKECPHNVTSPLLLKGKDFIRTKNNGFYNVRRTVASDGSVSLSKGKPNYEDLLKYFDKQHYHISTPARFTYVWDATHWVVMHGADIEAFAEEHFDPAPSSSMVAEFKNKVRRTNMRPDDWFNQSTYQKINLDNGVLVLDDKHAPELKPHSRKYGFTSIQKYEYNPEATAPRFDKFLDEVTLGRKELRSILLEFMAYVVANHDCTRAKSLFLLGDGSNGKSKFVELLQDMLGEGSCSAVPLGELNKDQMRALLINKLVNISEETPSRSLIDSAYFKSLVSGGSTTAKVVYKEPTIFRNRCKLINLCNSLPGSADMTHGNLRRLLIVPFDAKFEKEDGTEDLRILDKLLSEKSGILNMIIEANASLVDNGFTSSDITKTQIEEYQKENDHVYSFLYDTYSITGNTDDTFLAKDIFVAYGKYCLEQEIRDKHNAIAFGIKFTAMCKRHNVFKRKKKDGMYYRGLKLANEQVANNF